MGDVTMLLTGVGCPGATTTIGKLRRGSAGAVRIVGTDMMAHASGRHFVDAFYQVPPGKASAAFISTIKEIIQRGGIDVILPQIADEQLAFADARHELSVPVIVPVSSVVDLFMDKWLGFWRLHWQVPVPQTYLCQDVGQVEFYAHLLGYPDRQVILKPRKGKGGRGTHVLDANACRVHSFLSGRAADTIAAPVQLDEALSILEQSPRMPDVVLQEYVDGPEYTVTALCWHGEVLVGGNIVRETVRCGHSIDFVVRERPDLSKHVETIVGLLDYTWFINVQFKGDKVMEVNPRISTLVTPPGVSLPWLAVELALGHRSVADVAEIGARLEPTVNATRFYDQIFWEVT